MDVSIVIPVYNEENNVEMLHSQIKGVMRKYDHEIIFVDDGSTDKTFDKLNAIDDNCLTIIKLRKNFGQTAALSAGFKEAKGKIIVQMDGDLQNDPQDIPKLIGNINGYDVVSGWRHKRQDSLTKRLFSKIANKFRIILLKELIQDSGCSMRAYKRECFEDIDLYGDMHRFIPSLLSWKGFRITEIKVNHFGRKYGETKYGSGRLFRGLLDLLTILFWKKYSNRPLHIFGGVGIALTIFGLMSGLYAAYLKIFRHVDLSNTFLPVISIFLVIIGIQFFVSGLLADIAIKTYYNKDRKTY